MRFPFGKVNKMKTKKRNRGVITVMVSLLLVGILSMGTLTIEAGRMQAAKTQLAEANISASTSMIASYDSDLYGRFGLLAIDTDRFTTERATDYLTFNADQAAGYRGNRLSRLYVLESVEMEGMYNLTYPSILKRQLLSRAKYHVVPRDYALNVENMDGFFADFQAKCLYVARELTPVADGYAFTGELTEISQDTLNALAALYATYGIADRWNPELGVTLSGSAISLLPSVTGTVESNIPAEDLADINSVLSDANSLLGASGSLLAYGNGSGITETDVSVSASCVSFMHHDLDSDLMPEGDPYNVRQLAKEIKTMAQGFNAALNALSGEKESNILLNSYIVQYFSNRTNRINIYSGPAKGTVGSMENGTFASACVEYLIGGSSSELTNQEAAYEYIQAIRLINNLYAVMTTSNTFDSYSEYSLAAHIAWANYESMVDLELMTRYGLSVPFNKNKMILPVNDPAAVATAYAQFESEAALIALGLKNGETFQVNGAYPFSYTDSLAFALWFQPNSEKLLQVADLIQLEMRYQEQYKGSGTATFLMSEQNTYCRIKCTAKFNAALPLISLDPENTLRGLNFQSIKYSGY